MGVSPGAQCLSIAVVQILLPWLVFEATNVTLLNRDSGREKHSLVLARLSASLYPIFRNSAMQSFLTKINC